MEFNEVTRKDIETLRPGLQLLELALTTEALSDLYLYGLTTDGDVIECAREVLQDEMDADDEAEPQTAPALKEVAVALPASPDTLYYLVGSGLRLQHESFAYRTPNEDARTRTFTFASFRPDVRVEDFTTLCLQEGSDYLDEFLKKFGSQEAPVPVTPKAKEPPKGTFSNPIDDFLSR